MTVSLLAQKREITGKKVQQLRRDGQAPIVLYGHGTETTPLVVDHKALTDVWTEVGGSQLVDLTIDGEKPVKVLIHDIQIHPVTRSIVHADLYQVKMTEKIETEIPLEFIGEAPAVKELEGSLMTEKDALEVRCLPGDLVPEFQVDISVLATFDDVIKVSDVKIPATIEVLNDADEVVALVQPPRSEEELAELDETTDEQEEAGIAQIEAAAEAENAEASEESDEE